MTIPTIATKYTLLALVLILATGTTVAENTAVNPHQLGTQYSPLEQINTSNVANLEPAWEYHTGDLPPEEFSGLVAFKLRQ